MRTSSITEHLPSCATLAGATGGAFDFGEIFFFFAGTSSFFTVNFKSFNFSPSFSRLFETFNFSDSSVLSTIYFIDSSVSFRRDFDNSWRPAAVFNRPRRSGETFCTGLEGITGNTKYLAMKPQNTAFTIPFKRGYKGVSFSSSHSPFSPSPLFLPSRSPFLPSRSPLFAPLTPSHPPVLYDALSVVLSLA